MEGWGPACSEMARLLAQFFQTNRVILYSVYGQVFFVLGLAIALQSRKHSRLALAHSLRYLAAYGFLHGLHEWGYVFIPIQAQYLPANFIDLLEWGQLLLLVLSFLALLLFGLDLLSDSQRQSTRWVITGVLSVAWMTIPAGVVLFAGQPRSEVLAIGNVAARYLVGVPAALVSAAGLRKQAAQLAEREPSRIARYLRYAAWPLLVYAVFGGLIAPKSSFLFSSWLNEDLIVWLVGIPTPVFRSLAGVALAYFIIRAQEVFELETDQLIEEIQRARLLADDRERISRELHDGTIQSIYAAGLMLEDISLTIPDDPPRAQKKLRQVMADLNHVIGEVRRYIFDLRSQLDDKTLTQQIEELVQAHSLSAPFEVDLAVVGDCPKTLPPQLVQNVLRVVGEALNNVRKHAGATQVSLRLEFDEDQLTLEVGDNGIGFDKYPTRLGQGFLNMRERVQLLGGYMVIDGRRGEGVRLMLTAPFDQDDAELTGTA